MAAKLETEGELYQADAVWEIGDEFVYENDRGNEAIARSVLREFRRLTEETVVWEPRGCFWRQRDATDPEGQRRAD
jgi:hypothetical protein